MQKYNVTSRRPSSETACILLPGADVPSFIVHESVVAYQYARELDGTDLAKFIAADSPIPKGFCSQDLLLKIQRGALISERLKKKYKTALQACWEYKNYRCI